MRRRRTRWPEADGLLVQTLPAGPDPADFAARRAGGDTGRMGTSAPEQVRLAEIVAALSLATDLGTGQPMGHALRTCHLAMGVARELGASPHDLFETYYTSLLRFLGCTSESSADATLNGGDDIALLGGLAPSFMGRPTEAIGWMMRHLAEGQPPLRRARALVGAFTDPKGAERAIRAHCEVGQMLARRLGLGTRVLHALGRAYERWDGKGLPDGVEGEEVPFSCRAAIVARDYDLLNRVLGSEEATEVLRSRRGRAYEPRALDTILEHGPRLTAEVEEGPLWETVLEGEPGPHRIIEGAGIDDALGAFAHFVDLKSPFLHGHSIGVAELAERAAEVVGASEIDPRRLRRAGLLHDLGRVAVPSGIWNKKAALSTEEWEQVRLHPYYTERILVRCGPLEDLAETASSHHERMDGSGYHRAVRAPSLTASSRLLAAADAFTAMTQSRPHRPALSTDAAVEGIERACEGGQMDLVCARAVLEAAGHRGGPGPSAWPAGLTDREVEVLRLLVTGLSNKQIAHSLTISPKTVGRHIENIYSKSHVSTRAGATLFAMEQGLVNL